MRIVVGILGGIAVLACACQDGGKATAPPVEPPAPVRTAVASREDVPVAVRAIGWVESYATVTVKPRIEGQLDKIYFEEGKLVQAGDLLASLDPRPIEAELRLAQANLVRDQVMAKDSRQEAARVIDLFQKNIAAERERDKSVALADAADAQAQADEAAVASAKLRLEYCTIRSPITGIVGARLADAGNIVKANEAPIVVVNQITPVYVTFAVAEKHLGQIKDRMTKNDLTVVAQFADEKSEPERGVLKFVDNQVDRATGMVRLKATFENATRRLWPGRYVNVSLVVSTTPDAVVVPATAVVTAQTGSIAYVVKSDKTVELRTVEAGESQEGRVVISRGIAAGETVVTDGQLRLVPGAKVEITEAVAASAPAVHAPSTAMAQGGEP